MSINVQSTDRTSTTALNIWLHNLSFPSVFLWACTHLAPKLIYRFGKPLNTLLYVVTTNVWSWSIYNWLLLGLTRNRNMYIRTYSHRYGLYKYGLSAFFCILLCLYLSIPHGEGLASLRRFLESRYEKQVSNNTLAEFAE